MNTRSLRATIALLSVAMAAACLAQTPQKKLDASGSTKPAPTTVTPREGCVTSECHPGIKERAYVHGPIRTNGCDGCHTLTDASKHKFEPIRDRHEMCAFCHTNEIPVGSIVLHEPFAKSECLSCHDPHGSPESRLLRGERYADSCAACHKDVTGAHDRVHGPASVGACGACHEPHASRSAKLLREEGRELCLRCHVRVDLELRTKSIVHAPVLGDCQTCHDPHATDQRGLLTRDPASLCTECHKDIGSTMANASTQHAAITTKRACLNCHSPHASDHAALLKDTPQNLCFECHNEPVAMPDGSKLANMKKVIETGKSLHGAITQRGCVECHEIHGGGHRRLLTNEYPSGVYYPFGESTYDLCFSCHDKQLVMLARTGATTNFRNGELNLHFVHVNNDKKGRTCKACHDAHAASREKHIRDDVPFGKKGWKLPIRFEALPAGGRCGAGCHAAYEYNRDKPILYPPLKLDGAWKGADLAPGVLAEPPKPAEGERKK